MAKRWCKGLNTRMEDKLSTGLAPKKLNFTMDASSPSPPTLAVRSMHLASRTACVSPVSVHRSKTRSAPRRRLLATPQHNNNNNNNNNNKTNEDKKECVSPLVGAGQRRLSVPELKSANRNPFTPAPRRLSAPGLVLDSATCSGDPCDLLPSKRVRVSEVEVSRYATEFVELQELAVGAFGHVKVAQHRLDGMVYAVKMTRQPINNASQEHWAMNEVFAHAALIKHKHIVRYYSCWVEAQRVFIQTELCEGGSLAALIRKRREQQSPFSEAELKRILCHVAKGLSYLHANHLVHMDVKPENVFIALDYENAQQSPLRASTSSGERAHLICTTPKSNAANESTDSGHHSDASPDADVFKTGSISYKIGDLGHVVRLHSGVACAPEEGDCRYMAPELFAFDVDWEKLPKADIFSLGLTLFECASLIELPKNSEENELFLRLQAGDLPHLDNYSEEFNLLLKSMVSSDPMSRPSAFRLSRHPLLQTTSKKSRSNIDMVKQLKAYKARIQELESMITQGRTSSPKRVNLRGSKKNAAKTTK